MQQFFQHGPPSEAEPAPPPLAMPPSPDWARSMALCKSLLSTITASATPTSYGKHNLLRAMADMYKEGGHGVEKDVDTARDYYYDAATSATVLGDRFFSAQ